MEINIGLVYGYLLIISGAVLALYSQLKSITSNLSETKNGISSIKWSQYAWFSFFSLTLMGTLVHLFNIFKVVNYRNWVWDFSGHSVVNCRNISNTLTILFDIIFIIICFLSLLISIRKVGMNRGKFSVSPDNKLELIFILIGHPAFAWLFLVFSAFIGVSYVLVGLYFIVIIPLSLYIIKYGNTN